MDRVGVHDLSGEICLGLGDHDVGVGPGGFAVLGDGGLGCRPAAAADGPPTAGTSPLAVNFPVAGSTPNINTLSSSCRETYM